MKDDRKGRLYIFGQRAHM